MKVAMVGPFPLTDRPAVGGIESVAVNLVGGLTDLGIDVCVVTCLAGATGPSRGSGFDIHVVATSVRMARLSGYALERRAVTEAVLAAGPDLVHVQGANFYGPAALAAGLPTVVTPHGILGREASLTHPASGWLERAGKRLRGRANARFERMTLERATDLVIISPYVEAVLRPLTMARAHPIPNPVSPPFFGARSRPEPGRVLFVGGISPRKNTLLLVHAFGRVAAVSQEARLQVVGTPLDAGYHRTMLAAMADPALNGRAGYLGVVSEARLVDEYERAALLVLPSREESSPMVIQQAMATGLPVVAARAGGIDRLVENGGTGLLVAPDDEAALADAIIELLGDPERCRAMGCRARAGAERFRPATVATATVEVYRDLLSRGRLEASPA